MAFVVVVIAGEKKVREKGREGKRARKTMWEGMEWNRRIRREITWKWDREGDREKENV